MHEYLLCKHLVLKVASRCNLNCTYCYMYNLGDDTYKSQPKFMSDAVVDALLERVNNHCRAHGIDAFTFVFHGGEPLLAKPAFFEAFVHKARRVLAPLAPVFKLQTNGTLLTEEWCRLFGRLHIGIGISLDGTPEENDVYRVDHAGRGSYPEIVRGLRIGQASAALGNPPGIVSFINIDADPLKVYQHFKSLDISYIDYILPDATHDNPPHGLGPPAAGTPYADWLITVFDDWFYDNGRKPKVRMFETIIMLILGRGTESGSDAMGAGRHQVLVIETDGGIEPIDSLKVCGNGFTKVGANVLTHELDNAIATELSTLSNLSHQRLCKQCCVCPISEVCGGGYLSHRYSVANGFNNPSVYCKDLVKLITHIQARVLFELPRDFVQRLNLSSWTVEEVYQTIEDQYVQVEDPAWESDLLQFRRSV